MDPWLGLGIFLLGAGFGALITHIAELRHSTRLSTEVRPARATGSSLGPPQLETKSWLPEEEVSFQCLQGGYSHGTSPARSDV